MTTPAIEAKNLVVRAWRRDILSLTQLGVAGGELVGMLGPNGAGKTTLLRCLLGVQAHASGRVAVLGEQIDGANAAALARLRRRIGYVPQILPQRAEMPLTVREVVAIGRTGLVGLLHPLKSDDWRIVDEWLDRLGLADLAGMGFGQISGGEQRKALIARAMVHQPELLLLDEPTANLDLGWRERIVQVVGELHRRLALTVVLVCHELEVLPACCRRVIVLDGGRVIDDGRPEEVLSGPLIASLYGKGLSVVRSGQRWAVVPQEAAHA